MFIIVIGTRIFFLENSQLSFLFELKRLFISKFRDIEVIKPNIDFFKIQRSNNIFPVTESKNVLKYLLGKYCFGLERVFISWDKGLGIKGNEPRFFFALPTPRGFRLIEVPLYFKSLSKM